MSDRGTNTSEQVPGSRPVFPGSGLHRWWRQATHCSWLRTSAARGPVSPSLPRTSFPPKMRPLPRAGKDHACLAQASMSEEERGDVRGAGVSWEAAFGRPLVSPLLPELHPQEGPRGCPRGSLRQPQSAAGKGHCRGRSCPRCPPAALCVEAVTMGRVPFLGKRVPPLQQAQRGCSVSALCPKREKLERPQATPDDFKLE